MNILKRYWLPSLFSCWLLTGCEPLPRSHGPYMTCDDCALQMPPADPPTATLIREQMPRLYTVPWIATLTGARFTVCNARYCATYRMTADGRFNSDLPPFLRDSTTSGQVVAEAAR